MAKKTVKKQSRKREKTYRVVPFNIHVKGPNLNKGYAELFSKIEKDLMEGELKVRPNSKGVVIRCMSGVFHKKHNVTQVSLLKYNERSSGLAWDLSKEMLITNTSLVTAQVVTGFFFHDHHLFAMLPKAHGPSDDQIEDYLIKVFDLAASSKKGQYDIDVKVFKQEGVTEKLSSWDIIKSIKIEVFRNNPINDEVGNNLSELADLLESDKLEITARANAKRGVNKASLEPILEGGDKLIETGRARITAEGIVDGHKDFIDSKESKTRRLFVRSYADDENGLIGKIAESVMKLFGR